jgi:recombination protein RecA
MILIRIWNKEIIKKENYKLGEIKKYTDVVRLGHRSTIGVLNEGDHITITEKIDGCFHYGTLITLADGSQIPIGRIVKNKMDVEVLSYNFEKEIVEPKKIINWFNYGKKKDFISFRIQSIRGGRANRIVCTSDHLIYTNKGFIKAKDLTKDHKIYANLKKIHEIQKQLILGTLLGDSSVFPNKNDSHGNNGIVFNHSIKQIEYLELKKCLLGVFYSSENPQISGYGSQMMRVHSTCNPAINSVSEICYINNKKTVSDKWLNELSPIGIAFWYMDDGSLSSNSSQRDRAVFHTQGFSKEECDIIINFFYEKYRIKANKIQNKGWRIDLDTNGSEKLFSIIAPYIHTSMQYKIPLEYRLGKSFWDYFKIDNQHGLVPLSFIEHENELPDYLSQPDN